MRIRLLAQATALLLVPLSLGGAAAADPGSGERPVAGQAAAPLRQQAEATLSRAEALFTTPSPAAVRGRAAASGRDATTALAAVLRTRAALSDADRTRADALLARPTEPGGDGTVEYAVEEAPPHCGGIICIHYVTSTADAPPPTDRDGDTVPDTVEQALANARLVNDTYVDAGYRRPDPDGTLGGSNRVDVYLADVGDLGLYGYCTSDQPQKTDGTYNYWAYCVIDDDFAPDQFPTHTPLQNQQVTLAHEYFHAVQFAYDAWEDPWFLEATATWAEDELFDDVNDNWGYLGAGQLRRPAIPLDRFDGSSLSHYGNWVFFRHLTERWPATTGGMPTLMLELIEGVSARAGESDSYSTMAIHQALAARGSSFTAAYGQFALANRQPRRAYEEGAAYPVARPARTWNLGKRRRATGPVATRLPHLTSRTFRFRPGSALRQRRWRLRVKVDAPVRRTAPVVGIAVHLGTGEVATRTVRLDTRTRGNLALPFSARTVRYVDVVLVNASRRTTDCWTDNQLPVFACSGVPRDDGARSVLSARVFRR